MRQRDSKLFAEMPSRLREGKHSAQDIMKSKERVIESKSKKLSTRITSRL